MQAAMLETCTRTQRECIIILDVVLGESKIRALETFGCRIVYPSKMTDDLLAWSGWITFDRKRTLLIFPGNGADIVQRTLPGGWLSPWSYRAVYAKRYWHAGQNPQVEAGRITNDYFLLGVHDVVIVDDVISSGTTCTKLKERNAPWIPGARWHAVTWVRQRSATLRGFASVVFVWETGTPQLKSPINSLSTLLNDDDIARSYAARNILEPQRFLAFLQWVRSEAA